jgi:hypothetical protein
MQVLSSIIIQAKPYEIRYNPKRWVFKYELGRWEKSQQWDTNTGYNDGNPYWTFRVINKAISKTVELEELLEFYNKEQEVKSQ